MKSILLHFTNPSDMKITNGIFILLLTLLLYILLKPREQLINFNKTKENLRNFCKTTIVTAYYKMRSKHSYEEYVSWISNMLTFTDCMVIFTEQKLVG